MTKTDVHYPTDINMLFDAIRKMVTLVMRICYQMDISEWRQGKHHIRKAKKLYRRAQQLKRSSSKDEAKKAERDRLIIEAHNEYIDLAQSLIDKTRQALISIQTADIILQFRTEEVNRYIAHGERQIDQIRRRVINGETIAHHEKVFSIFEEHTEWISKGKAGVPVELGLKVCIVKDQNGFTLHHRVMINETDDKIAVSIVDEAQSRFPNLASCSFDKGFHSSNNQEELANRLEKVVLPRKGKLSAINKEIENSEDFKEARRKHSAVESAINALGNHGLDRCPDHGLNGFKRYVSLAVVSRNLQILGHMLQQKEVKRLRRQENIKRKAA